jgi:hypothetical protein
LRDAGSSGHEEPDGEATERTWVTLTIHHDAVVTGIEIFSEEDLDAATARVG